MLANEEQSRPASCMPYVVHSKFDVNILQHFLQETGKQCISLEALHAIPVSERDSSLHVILVKVHNVFDLTILRSGKTWKSFRVDEVSLDAGALTVDGSLFLAAQGEAAKPAEDYVSNGDVLAIVNPTVLKSSKPNTLFDIRFSSPSHLFVWKADLKDISNVEAHKEVKKDPWDVPSARSTGEVYRYFNLKMNAQKLGDNSNFYALVTGILRSPTQTQTSKTNWHAMYSIVDDSCCPPLQEGSPEYENWVKDPNGEPKDYVLHIFDKSKPEAFPPIRLGDVIRPEKKKNFGNAVKTNIRQSDIDFRTFSGSNVIIFRRDEAPICTSKSYSLTAEERRLAIRMLHYAEMQEKEKIDKVLAFSELSAYATKTEALVNLCGRVLSVRSLYEDNSLFFAIYLEDGTVCPLPLAKLTSDAPKLNGVRQTPTNYPVIKICVPVAKKDLDIEVGKYLLFRGVHLKMNRKEDYEYFRFELRGVMCKMSDTSNLKALLCKRIFDSKKTAVPQASPEPMCTSTDELAAELSPFLLEAAGANQQQSVCQMSSPLFPSAEEPIRTGEIMEVNEIMRIVNGSASFVNSDDPEPECNLPISTNVDTLVTSTPLKNADQNLNSNTPSRDIVGRNLALELALDWGAELESSPQGRASVSPACRQINGTTSKSQTQACSSTTDSDDVPYATPYLQPCEVLLETVPSLPSPARQQIQEVCSSDFPAVKQEQGDIPSRREVAYAQMFIENEIVLNSSVETEGWNQDEITLDSESQAASSSTCQNGLVSLQSANRVMLKRTISEKVSQENLNSSGLEPEYSLPVITNVDNLVTSTPLKKVDQNLSSSVTSSPDILSRNLEMELTLDLNVEPESAERRASPSQTCRQLDGLVSKPQTQSCSSTMDSDNTPYASPYLQPCEELLRKLSSLPSIAHQQIQELGNSDLPVVVQGQGNVPPRREVGYTQVIKDSEVILNSSTDTEGRNQDEITLDSESQATPSVTHGNGLGMVELQSTKPLKLKRASFEQEFEGNAKKMLVGPSIEKNQASRAEGRCQASQSVVIEWENARKIYNGTKEIEGDTCRAELKTLVAKAQLEVIESIWELKHGRKKAKIVQITMDKNLCKFDVDGVLSNWVFGFCVRCSVAYPYADFRTFPVTEYMQSDYVPQYDGNILKEITVNNFREGRVNVEDVGGISRKYCCKSYHCPNCTLAGVNFDESYLVLSYTTKLKLQDVRGETAEGFLTGHAADFFWGVPAIAFVHNRDSQQKLISNVRKLSGQHIRVQIQMFTEAAGQREFHVVGTRNEF